MVLSYARTLIQTRPAATKRPATLHPDQQEEEPHAPVQPPTAVQLPASIAFTADAS
jgi:hypothetical protein